MLGKFWRFFHSRFKDAAAQGKAASLGGNGAADPPGSSQVQERAVGRGRGRGTLRTLQRNEQWEGRRSLYFQGTGELPSAIGHRCLPFGSLHEDKTWNCPEIRQIREEKGRFTVWRLLVRGNQRLAETDPNADLRGQEGVCYQKLKLKKTKGGGKSVLRSRERILPF